MQVQRVQNYNVQSMNINQPKRQQNAHSITFGVNSGIPQYSNKGCGFLMGIALATLIGTITTPIVTYNCLSKDEKNSTIGNVFSSIAAGIATLGAGGMAFFYADEKCENKVNNKN